MAHRAWGSAPHFALCNSLFWQEALRGRRDDRRLTGRNRKLGKNGRDVVIVRTVAAPRTLLPLVYMLATWISGLRRRR